jgi:hypothetical protein
MTSRLQLLVVVSSIAFAAACSSEKDSGENTPSMTGGAPAAGGVAASTGGQLTPGSGGVFVTGGMPSTSTGGANTGGTTATGGANSGGFTPGSGGAPPDGSAGSDAGGTTGSTLPPISDYAAAGPFKTKTDANVGPSNKYTVYRPDPLGENGFVHSPIVFGPGILTSAANYKAFLDHLATHGFVTISVNSMSGGPNDPGNLKAMRDGLEWLVGQNAASGVYQGKLAVRRAVAMGYSIGATASTQLSSHEAVMTTVSIHGHNTSGDPHGPILLLTGTDDVIDDNRKTLTTLSEAPAILAALPIGHLDVLTELAMSAPISPSTRYVAPITAWLRYWVNGDQGAKGFFWGADCTMCSSPWIAPETNAAWKAQTL